MFQFDHFSAAPSSATKFECILSKSRVYNKYLDLFNAVSDFFGIVVENLSEHSFTISL